MNRRQFLGLGLVTAASPVLAANPFTSSAGTPRTLTFHHLHTKEDLTVTYRIGDSYQRDALRRLNELLRDFRTEEVTVMDPRLFDLLYDINQVVGARHGVFEVLSAYRSPSTNAMLRQASHRVAKGSLHLSGQAIDVRHSDASCRQIQRIALDLQRGGVGFYTSSDFVHLDTGTVRRWGA